MAVTASDLTRPATIHPWRLDASAVASALETRTDEGLVGATAEARLAEYGTNELVEQQGRPTWRLFVDQVTSPMILVLIGAAVVTALIGHH